MRILIIILGLFIMANKIKSIKNMSKTKKEIIFELKLAFNKLQTTLKFSKDEVQGLLIVISLIFVTVPYFVFYTLSFMYVDTFIFTIISLLQIIGTIRSYCIMCKMITEIDYLDQLNIDFKINWFIIICDMIYISYVFLNIRSNWV